MRQSGRRDPHGRREINSALLLLLLDFVWSRYASLLRLPSPTSRGTATCGSSKSQALIQYTNEIRKRRRTASHGYESRTYCLRWPTSSW